MRNRKDKMTFDRLVSSIQQVCDYLSAQAGKAVNISLTMRNWIIGLYIAEFEMHGADRAGYGNKLLASLADEQEKLNISACGKRQRYQYLCFYQMYPQIVRSLTTQLHDLIPDAITDIEKKVRSTTALSGIDPQMLLQRLSYTHIENLVAIDVTQNVLSMKLSASEATGRCENSSVRSTAFTVSAPDCPKIKQDLPNLRIPQPKCRNLS